MSPRHVFAATFVATLVLNACSRPAEPPRPPEPPAAPQPPAPPEPTAPSLGNWTNIAGEEGVALLLTDEEGNGVFQLACMKAEDRMVVRVAPFRVIESEERLSFGVDDDPFVFVAETQTPTVGVEATSPIVPELLARLPMARQLTASYGASTLGPMAPPTPEQSRRFVDGCLPG